MRRSTKTYPIEELEAFKNKALHWASNNDHVVWLDSNESPYGNVEAILAVGKQESLVCSYKNAFQKLKNFYDNTQDYLFGYFGYDLKNDVENLSSENDDWVAFEDLHFIQPEKIIFISKNEVEFAYPMACKSEMDLDFKEILEKPILRKHSRNAIKIKIKLTQKEYIDRVNQMLQHIQRGDIYEANFCQEFYAENSDIDALSTFLHLNQISKAPFTSFLKLKDKYLLSASPERFIQKTGERVISQPIKGTSKRHKDSIDDQISKNSLKKSTKEIAENVMIVDLVRNDLSHIAQKGSVNVDELCGLYTFEQVHQMISTVSCLVKERIHPVDIIKACFPMGSMTGAPKVSAMQIIEKLEVSKRGLYSGAVGYFTPDGDFDFNVVIRSILYNQSKKALSFSVGSAITAKADPKQEYQECLLKAKAMKQVLTSEIDFS